LYVASGDAYVLDPHDFTLAAPDGATIKAEAVALGGASGKIFSPGKSYRTGQKPAPARGGRDCLCRR
jgi:hypothetical protein